MSQPKDYVEEEYNAMIAEEYSKLPLYLKIVYQLQNHIIKTIITTLIIGYLAGTYFGKFW